MTLASPRAFWAILVVAYAMAALGALAWLPAILRGLAVQPPDGMDPIAFWRFVRSVSRSAPYLALIPWLAAFTLSALFHGRRTGWLLPSALGGLSLPIGFVLLIFSCLRGACL